METGSIIIELKEKRLPSEGLGFHLLAVCTEKGNTIPIWSLYGEYDIFPYSLMTYSLILY